MGSQEKDNAPRASQTQDSRQSARQGGQKTHREQARGSDEQVKSGIGSSQGQDRPAREEQQGGRPSAGTADIERGSSHDIERRGSQESLVNESTGAFKERP